ncbi:MAG TPA: DinB family protein [Nocardioides sp.]|nr:DinB family protein [Nocardioides sp.]
MSEPVAIEPDTKDWTWVLERPCPDCGFDGSEVEREQIGAAVRANAQEWLQALAAPQAAERPEPTVWSPTEYACHVRDVHRIFGTRLALMLGQDDPQFANWDQDETAVADRYDLQQPDQVAAELAEEADRVATAYDGVAGDAWQRTGTRSNGSGFTVETLGLYHLHDAVHHAWDVRWVHEAESGGA